jgi:hypothetical protein
VHPEPGAWRASVAACLAIVAALAIGWAATIAVAGGVRFYVAALPITSTDPWRPLGVAIAAGAIAIGVAGSARTRHTLRRLWMRAGPAGLAATLAAVVTIAGLAGNSWTASGPDPFAYVSEAALIRQGRLSRPVSLAAGAPWPDAVTTFAPFGYRAAPDGSPTLHPFVWPGVPLAMAMLQAAAGHCAAFVLTPVCAGLFVWMAFAIGRRVGSPATGLASAWIVATSPALLFSAMWPMSDVPAALCASAMVACLLARPAPRALTAGLAGSAGLLSRPTVLPIAVATGLWLIYVAWRTRTWRAVAGFLAGVVPGLAATLWFNAVLVGSPLASGYGSPGEMFRVSRLGANAAHYALSLVQTTPILFGGLAALLLPRIWRRVADVEPRAGIGPRSLLAAATLGTISLYLFYEPFPEWWYLRFLLPAWPLLACAAAVALDAVRVRGRAVSIGILVLLIGSGIAGLLVASARGIFSIGMTERRYATVARLVAAHTEPDAVVLTWMHSGTVHYYAGRETIRFDVLDPAWLDRAVDWLGANGRHPYVLVEDFERDLFETRFGGRNRQGSLAYAPVLAWESSRVPGRVFLYDPSRRDAVTAQPSPYLDAVEPICAPPAR